MSTVFGAIGGKERGLAVRVWIIVLAIAVVVFGLNTGLTLYYAAHENTARGRVAEIQVQSQQLAKFAAEAVNGNADAFAEFKAVKTGIDGHVGALRTDYDGAQGVGDDLARVVQTWTPTAANADRIIASEKQVLGLAGTANTFVTRVPQLQARLDEVARAMSSGGSPADQVLIAVRQIVLADRMSRRVTEIRAGGTGAVSARDALGRDASLFGQVLGGLQNGNEELGIRQITNANARSALDPVIAAYADVQKDVDSVLAASTQLYEVQQAATAISEESDVLLDNSNALYQAFDSLPNTRLFPNNILGLIAGLATLIAIVGLLAALYRDQRARFRSTQELNQRNQEAILRLLDEMGTLAEGDLTVKATVTEDITGAIADSINFTVEALRSLVTTINETSVQVAAAAQETQATAMHLAEAAEHQAQQINSASTRINEIAVSIDEVSKNSAESADVAQRSVQIAAKGADVVRQTIQGMDNIRDQIQETSKRIKRLGESSQEIGSIVELINDIAEQTNILALNAAIQAASAGEAGRGFAVVADEVQRLAERASNATKRIETLVQTIQSDTNEAVSSMEQTTSEVVAGARLAEDAGLALGEIETVSNDLASLIQNISSAAQQQSAAATNITATMKVIQEITSQTSQGAGQTAESIGNLAQLAADLRRSVADFKLPS